MQLPPLRRQDLDQRGQATWDAVVASRGPVAVDDDGHLVGPFNAFVHAPDVGLELSRLGAALRFASSLPPRLVELVILTAGAHWRAEFEWWAHSRLARDQGIGPDVVAAIGRGETPSLDSEAERSLHAFARELLETGTVGDATARAAEATVGRQGLVEVVSLCGYYSLVSFLLNAFDVPLPPGVTPHWGDPAGAPPGP